MEYSSLTLPNGIRLVHISGNNHVSHFGLLLNTGSREELDHEHGMAHFIEHVIFKGTEKRRAFHILSRLDDVGGEINAYTTKEETAFYASFLNPYYERAIELLADIIFHSVFPARELAREKDVILDEINSYKDSPSDLIFDDFEELLFKNHPIGRNILGTRKTLKHFNRKTIEAFMQRTYHTDEMVLCSVGNIPFKKLSRLAYKYFAGIAPSPRDFTRTPVTASQPVREVKKLQTYQAHCVVGNTAYAAADTKRMTLILLNNIIGGQGLNSRLNLSLRERHGLAYNVESNYTPYVDTGVFNIYFGTDKDNLEHSLKLVYKELDVLRNKQMGTLQLRRAKNQILGQIAMSTDNKESLLFTLGKSILLFDRFDSLEKISQQIEAITASDIMDVANEILNWDQLTILIYQ